MTCQATNGVVPIRGILVELFHPVPHIHGLRRGDTIMNTCHMMTKKPSFSQSTGNKGASRSLFSCREACWQSRVLELVQLKVEHHKYGDKMNKQNKPWREADLKTFKTYSSSREAIHFRHQHGVHSQNVAVNPSKLDRDSVEVVHRTWMGKHHGVGILYPFGQTNKMYPTYDYFCHFCIIWLPNKTHLSLSKCWFQTLKRPK